MSKLAGCSKDHAKEIDLYNKSFDDKVERIKKMMDLARLAVNDIDEGGKKEELLQKASYYFA